MVDREKVIYSIERCICHVPNACRDCAYDPDPYNMCVETLLKDALSLLKAQEPVEPRYIDGKRNHFIMCGNCKTDLIRGMKYCSYCGKAVKWDG